MDETELPSIAEILKSDQWLLDPKDSWTHSVVRVRDKFAVKYGPQLQESEADSLRFLADTAVPVPKLYGYFKDPDSNKSFLVTEYIEGQDFEKLLPSLSLEEREDVFEQIRLALVQMRSFEKPSPGYLGRIGRRTMDDIVFGGWDEADPDIAGPFANENDMNRGILQHIARTRAPPLVNFMRGALEKAFRGHQTVFTHGDLQAKNIMVTRKGTKQDGVTAKLSITIIDWESAGWYPEFFEFCTAACREDSKPIWLEGLLKIMTPYPIEYVLLRWIRTFTMY